VTPTLTLATKNAFATCAALVFQSRPDIRILSSTPSLGEALTQYLKIAPGPDCSLNSTNGSKAPAPTGPFPKLESSLVLLQPVMDTIFHDSSFLSNPKAMQVIILQSSWLGRKLLPEWRMLPGQQMSSITKLRQILPHQTTRPYKEITIGNVSSLFWGFFSGRLLASGRPDLADKCNASMRKYLIPSTKPYRLTYISIWQILIEV